MTEYPTTQELRDALEFCATQLKFSQYVQPLVGSKGVQENYQVIQRVLEHAVRANELIDAGDLLVKGVDWASGEDHGVVQEVKVQPDGSLSVKPFPSAPYMNLADLHPAEYDTVQPTVGAVAQLGGEHVFEPRQVFRPAEMRLMNAEEAKILLPSEQELAEHSESYSRFVLDFGDEATTLVCVLQMDVSTMLHMSGARDSLAKLQSQLEESLKRKVTLIVIPLDSKFEIYEALPASRKATDALSEDPDVEYFRKNLYRALGLPDPNGRYGVVYFDPKGGSDGKGCFDWAFCKDVPLAEAEDIVLNWQRVCGFGETLRPVYAVGVAPWRGYDVELETQDLAAALSWNRLWIGRKIRVPVANKDPDNPLNRDEDFMVEVPESGRSL
jgi:hypothetical protein